VTHHQWSIIDSNHPATRHVLQPIHDTNRSEVTSKSLVISSSDVISRSEVVLSPGSDGTASGVLVVLPGVAWPGVDAPDVVDSGVVARGGSGWLRLRATPRDAAVTTPAAAVEKTIDMLSQWQSNMQNNIHSTIHSATSLCQGHIAVCQGHIAVPRSHRCAKVISAC